MTQDTKQVKNRHAQIPLPCFFCNKTGIPLDWYREIKEYVCEGCAKKKKLKL